MMWTDLVQAYEAKLAVLEEARAAYSKAVEAVIEQTAPAMEAAVRAELEDRAVSSLRVEAVVEPSGDNSVLAGAPWARITVVDEVAGTEFRIGAWIGSSWGGPAGVLRVALSLEWVHSALNLQEWVLTCAHALPDGLPGEPFDSLDHQRFPETTHEWRSFRIASIELDNRDSREAVSEARDAAQAFARAIIPLLDSIRDAAAPMINGENALLRYRPTLVSRAQRAGVSYYPAKGLREWEGGMYLQVEDFWLATHPAKNQLVAACNKHDRDVVAGLAEGLEQEMGCIKHWDVVVLSEEDGLRSSEESLHEIVSAAFDCWFATKRLD